MKNLWIKELPCSGVGPGNPLTGSLAKAVTTVTASCTTRVVDPNLAPAVYRIRVSKRNHKQVYRYHFDLSFN